MDTVIKVFIYTLDGFLGVITPKSDVGIEEVVRLYVGEKLCKNQDIIVCDGRIFENGELIGKYFIYTLFKEDLS